MSGVAHLMRMLGQRRLLVLLPLGFASGLPLYLAGGRTFKAWAKDAGADLTTIGLLSVIALPYTLKFLWAPLVDRFVPPFLGRRRGWLLVMQLAIAVVIAAMAFADPRAGMTLAIAALALACLGATQDIVADAYRTDSLAADERGPGASLFVFAYRMGLLAAFTGALLVAEHASWRAAWLILAATMAVGVVGTLLAREPATVGEPPPDLAAAIIEPWREFVARLGGRRFALALAFVVLFRASDGLAGGMATTFLQERYSKDVIGLIQGGLGTAALAVGVVLGGTLYGVIGAGRALWLFGVLQAASNLGYWWLATGAVDLVRLGVVMTVESLCTGLSVSAFVAVLMGLCSARYSATQYALLTAAMAVGTLGLESSSGALAQAVGWPAFFLLTIVAAMPGLALLPWFAPWRQRDGSADAG